MSDHEFNTKKIEFEQQNASDSGCSITVESSGFKVIKTAHQNMNNSNKGIAYDPKLIDNVHMNKSVIETRVERLKHEVVSGKEIQIGWLLRAVTCIDLTTLCGDDCDSNVQRLCLRACNPIKKSTLQNLGFSSDEIKVGAVCVYPTCVPQCVKTFKQLGEKIPIASVAAAFPCGLSPLPVRCAEIKYAVEAGATEIDIVINRSLVITGQFEKLYNEVRSMKEACCDDAVHLKVILSVGELGSLDNVYKASMVSMMAGADFIKTSTGKEALNANFPCGVVMARAIRHYRDITGVKVGFKPAGGIKTPKDALMWLTLMNGELGRDWLFPNLFRIGASGLLDEIEKELTAYAGA